MTDCIYYINYHWWLSVELEKPFTIEQNTIIVMGKVLINNYLYIKIAHILKTTDKLNDLLYENV